MNPITIELPVSELKTALTGLGKVIPRSATLPVLHNLRITRSKDHLLTLQGTDLDAHVMYQSPEPNHGDPCDFLVPFDPLNRAIKRSTERIQLVHESKSRVKLRTFLNGTPIEQSLESLPVSDFPPAPLFTRPPVLLDGPFREALRQAMECTSADETRAVIKNVCLDVTDPKAHYVVGTDGRHLFSANSFAFGFKESVLLPDCRFLRWNGFMEEGRAELFIKPKVKSEGPYVQLKSGPWTFMARQSDVPFPNWRNAMPGKNSKGTEITLTPPAIETLLAGIPQLPGNDLPNKQITLDVSLRDLKVKARAKGASEWSVLPVDGIRIVGQATSVTLNRDYLVKALRFGLNTISILDEQAPVDFTNHGRRMLVMPVRPDPITTTKTTAPVAPPPPVAQEPQPTTRPQTPTEAPTQERTVMPRAVTPTTATTAETTEAPTDLSPMKQVMEKIDTIKEGLKGIVRDLTQALDLLKQVEKDKKASDREVEAIRGKLAEVQAIRI